MTGKRKHEADPFTSAVEVLTLSYSPKEVVARTKEKAVISEFIENALDSDAGASLYINGLPGTGKTASVTEIVHRITLPSNVRFAFLNSMILMTSAQSLWTTLLHQFEWKLKKGDKAERVVKTHFINPAKSERYLLVVDEIDMLATAQRAVLARLFQMAHPLTKGSRLILIGIANNLDLTSRPEFSLRPQVLQFGAYTKQQLADIVNARLADLPGVVLEKNMVELAARKAAAQSGDARAVLAICRGAILRRMGVEELCEGSSVAAASTVARASESAAGPVAAGTADDGSDDSESGVEDLDATRKRPAAVAASAPPPTKRVAVADVLSISDSVGKRSLAQLQTLPVMAQVVLGVATACGGSWASFTVGTLFNKFKAVVPQVFRAATSASEREFFELLEILTENGFLCMSKSPGKSYGAAKASPRRLNVSCVLTLKDSPQKVLSMLQACGQGGLGERAYEAAAEESA